MPNLPSETAGSFENVRESGALADPTASNLTIDNVTVADKQRVLPRSTQRRSAWRSSRRWCKSSSSSPREAREVDGDGGGRTSASSSSASR